MGFLIFLDFKGKGFEASYYQTFFRLVNGHIPVSFLPCTACWTRICPIAWQHVEKLPFHILNECRPKYKNITHCDRQRHKLSIKKWPQMTLVKDSPSSVQIFWRAIFHLVNQMGGFHSACRIDRSLLISLRLEHMFHPILNSIFDRFWTGPVENSEGKNHNCSYQISVKSGCID